MAFIFLKLKYEFLFFPNFWILVPFYSFFCSKNKKDDDAKPLRRPTVFRQIIDISFDFIHIEEISGICYAQNMCSDFPVVCLSAWINSLDLLEVSYCTITVYWYLGGSITLNKQFIENTYSFMLLSNQPIVWQ